MSQEKDMVNSPDHYTAGGMEVIDVIQMKMTPEEFEGYCMGNVLKYAFRSRYKGKRVEDLKKASWYLNKLISVLDENA